jgi:hypothetical protein
MTFTESDYMDRDPYRKLTVGLAHAFGGALLVTAGLPFILVIFGYFAKEVIFDLSRVFTADRPKWMHHIWADRWLVADSLTDWCFWWLGALMVQSGDARYGFAVLVVGAAYFVAGKWRDGKRA